MKITKLWLLTGMVMTLSLGGCTGGTSKPAPAPPAVTLKNVTLSTISDRTTNDAVSILKSASGEYIAYFAAEPGGVVTQAMVYSHAGTSHTVYYDNSGNCSKVVDNSSGTYLLLHPRADGQGMEYVRFGPSGTFLDGYAIVYANGAWNTAPILGIPASSANYGAAVYGTLTPVPAAMAKLFASSTAAKEAVFKEAAYVVTLADIANLKSSVCLFGFGMIIGGPTNPVGILSMIAGAAKAGEALANIQKNNFGVLDGVTGAFIKELDNGQETAAAGAAVISSYRQNGTLAGTNVLPTSETIAVADLTVRPRPLADTTPAVVTLPVTTATSSVPVPRQAPALVSSVSPDVAKVGVPLSLVVHGTGLNSWGSSLTLQVGGCPDALLVGGTDTALTFACTPDTAGPQNGTVFDNAGGVQLAAFMLDINGVDLPQVASVTPSHATLNVPTTFTVSGTEFIAGMGFNLEGCGDSGELAGGTATTRQFRCTPGATGPMIGYIKDKPYGTTSYTFHVQVDNAPVVVAPAPKITSFTPASGSIGTSVTIAGTDINTTVSNNIVRINGVQTTVTAATATSITFTIPAGASSGTLTLTTSSGTATSTHSFTITAAGGTTDDVFVLGNQAWSPLIYNNNSYYSGTNPSTPYAVTLCEWRNQPGKYGSGFGTGWRVPTKAELLTLVASSYVNWKPRTADYDYVVWSSTTGVPQSGYPTQAVVNLLNGVSIDTLYVNTTICVRPN